MTFDYKMEFVGNNKTQCYCGSTNCTGLIGDAKKIEDQRKIKKEKANKKKSKKNRHQVKPNVTVKRKELEESLMEAINATLNPFDLMMHHL